MKADAAAALATFIQDGLVFAAATIAWRQVSEARRLRQEQAQPYVVVSYEPELAAHGMTKIVIANVGATVAKNISFNFNPPLVSSLDEDSPIKVADWYAFTGGVPVLVPGQSMSTLFDALPYRCSLQNLDKYPRLTTVTVRYSNSAGKWLQHEYVLDFQVYFNRMSVSQKNLDDLARSVENIAKTMESWTEIGSGPGIRTYTQGLNRHRELIAENRRIALKKHQERVAAANERELKAAAHPEAPSAGTAVLTSSTQQVETPRVKPSGLVRLQLRRHILHHGNPFARRSTSA